MPADLLYSANIFENSGFTKVLPAPSRGLSSDMLVPAELFAVLSFEPLPLPPLHAESARAAINAPASANLLIADRNFITLIFLISISIQLGYCRFFLQPRVPENV